MRRLLTICCLLVAFFALFVSTTNNTQAESPRMVVMEQFTADWCGPCAKYSPPFHAFIQTQDNVIPLVYHVWNSDCFYIQDKTFGDARATYYAVKGVPDANIQGNAWKGNPASLQAAKDAFAKFAGKMSPVDMDVDLVIENGKCNVKVNVKTVEELMGYQLRILLVEYHRTYMSMLGKETAPNGDLETKWVPRKMLPDAEGTFVIMNAGEEKTFEQSCDWSKNWLEGNVYAVAFLQDDATKEIIQGASSLKLIKPSLTVAPTEQNTKAERNAAIEKTVSIKNNQDFAVEYQLSAKSSNTWQATVTPETVNIPANSSVDVKVAVNTGAGADYASVQVNAKPINTPQGWVTNEATSSLYFLTADTKYITLGTNLSQNNELVKSIKALDTKYGADWVFAPAADIIKNFSDANFDIAYVDVYAFDYQGFGIGTGLETFVLNRVKAGKKTIVSSNLGLYISSGALAQYGYIASADLKALYNLLGIEFYSSIECFDANSNFVQVKVAPVATSPLAEGVNVLTVNAANTTTGYGSFYIDGIKIKSGSTAMPILGLFESTYPADEYAAVYAQNGEAKTVYLGFPLESTTGNDVLVKNIVNWLEGITDVKDEANNSLTVTPNPCVTNTTVNYSVTEVTANVNVKVIDVTGATVAELVNDNLSQGNHFVNINTTDLSSGVYYVVTNINGKIGTTQLVVTK